MKKKSLAALCLIAALLIGILQRLQAERMNRKPLERSGFLFDTVIAVSLYGKQGRTVLDRTFQLLEHYGEVFSLAKTDNELYRMNHRSSDITTWKANPVMLNIVKLRLRHSELSDGVSDMTVLPLNSSQNFSGGEPKLPSETEIQAVLAKVDYRHVHIEGDVADFGNNATQTDSNSTAKECIADRLKDSLIEKGVKNAIINLGGNVLYIGERAKGKPFQIAIRRPEERSNNVVKILNIDGLSVASSGVYERYFGIDGVHYHHILNSRTGYLYQNGITSVAIVGPSSTECSVLSVAAFSLGQEAGITPLNRAEGCYDYMILGDGTILTSEGVQPGKNS